MKNSAPKIHWTLFTTLGWVAGVVAALLLVEPLDKIHLAFFGLGLGISAGIGFFQLIPLGKRKAIGAGWGWLTLAGMGTSFLLADLVIAGIEFLGLKVKLDGLPFLIMAVFASSLGGFAAGYLQNKFLLQKQFSASAGWPWQSFRAWFCASLFLLAYFAISNGMGIEFSAASKLMNLVAVMMVGPIVGWLTAKSISALLASDKTLQAQ